ncbi:MAG: DNA mismatch repair protein MutS [Peptostreptococcus sp.]|uniref:endonuclease MutS2 n=1 Tax=Peptostreptococcus sp. TaxID=1262 RepID=UPI002FC97874
MNKTLELIGFEEVRSSLKEFALTIEAKNKIDTMKPYENKEDLLHQLNNVTKAREMIENIGKPPLALMIKTRDLIDKCESGKLMEAHEIQDIGDFLRSVKQLKEYLNKGLKYNVNFTEYQEQLIYPEYVHNDIDRCIKSGRIVDEASSKLFKLRKKIRKLEPQLKINAQNTLDKNKKYASENFIVNRDGRWCVPVKKEYQHKISGMKISKSSTGNTIFIEPKAVTKIYEDYFQAKLDQYTEEANIINILMNDISEFRLALLENINIISTLDFIFAKAKLSIDMNASEAKINDERYINIEKARHPSIKENCVPLNYSIGRGYRGIIITGPNTGGKTVAIKTIALCSNMANYGLHVPAEKADIAFNTKIYCDIGDNQDIKKNLSTFSSHIKNVLDIIKNVDENSLVIFDELGSGTDPTEGMGIAISILEELRRKNSLFLVTTHYPEIKDYADKHEEIINARMAFDRENLNPLYRIELGKSGESCALHIAKKLGMPKYMLDIASRYVYGDINS